MFSDNIKVEDTDGLCMCDPVPNAGHSMYDEGILYDGLAAGKIRIEPKIEDVGEGAFDDGSRAAQRCGRNRQAGTANPVPVVTR